MTGRDHQAEDLQAILVGFAPRVYGLILRLVNRPDVAEDLMQEALLRAFRGLDTYRPEGKFRAWVFRIAVNVARDWLRRQPREPSAVLNEDSPSSAAMTPRVESPPDREVLRRERVATVEAALARLSQPDREVLLLRFYGDMPFKDIAKVTGEPLGTVLARAHRALRKLGDLISEETS